MTSYFDTHVHFQNETGDYSSALQVERALAGGVTRMVAVGGSCELNKGAAEAAEACPGNVRAAIGFDRAQVAEISSRVLIDDAIDRLRRSIDALRGIGATVCAIGEVGLDYHYTPQSTAGQVALFSAQCELAAERALPVIVHSREAGEDTLNVLRAYASQSKSRADGGVLHCFTGTMDFAERLMEIGFMISFSGIVSFAKADALRQVAASIPADRLLIETDSPYLAPVPHRGKRNEPAFVTDVAIALAHARGETVESVAAVTTANAHRLFGNW